MAVNPRVGRAKACASSDTDRRIVVLADDPEVAAHNRENDKDDEAGSTYLSTVQNEVRTDSKYRDGRSRWPECEPFPLRDRELEA